MGLFNTPKFFSIPRNQGETLARCEQCRDSWTIAELLRRRPQKKRTRKKAAHEYGLLRRYYGLGCFWIVELLFSPYALVPAVHCVVGSPPCDAYTIFAPCMRSVCRSLSCVNNPVHWPLACLPLHCPRGRWGGLSCEDSANIVVHMLLTGTTTLGKTKGGGAEQGNRS